MMKALVAIAVVCLVIATLPPIAFYLHFKDTLEQYQSKIESYELQISELQTSSKIDEEFKAKVGEFMWPYPYDPYLEEPFLVTQLGWDLHDSRDIVPKSRNKFTIYGVVWNIGAETAYNCRLIIKFYIGPSVMQTSELNMRTIRYWGEYRINKSNIDCDITDAVTKIEVKRTWTSTP